MKTHKKDDETSDLKSVGITEEKKTQEKDGDVKSEKGDEEDLRKGRIFDFIFKAENYFDEQSLEEMEKYVYKAKEEFRREKLGLMDREALRDRLNLLNIKHKGKDKLLHMKFCCDDRIHAISECCHNILGDRFKFNQKQFSKSGKS